MGLLKAHLHILAMQNHTHPMRGEVLCLGQQAVLASLEEVRRILMNHDALVAELPPGFDTRPKIVGGGEFQKGMPNCQAVFHMLGAKRVRVCDVSRYESPDLVINLNHPVDASLHGQFDSIIDVGTLEHVFDLPQALESIVAMLRTGGVLTIGVPASLAVNHGFYSLSPTLFLDYFGANGFTEMSFYLNTQSRYWHGERRGVYRLDPTLAADHLFFDGASEVFFFAKKGASANPRPSRDIMQSVYSKQSSWHDASAPDEPSTRRPRGRVKHLLRTIERMTARYRPMVVDELAFRALKYRGRLSYVGTY
jgi:hypothetical protein